MIRLYYHHHNNTYPGVNDEKGNPATNEAQALKGFEYQLFRYTDIYGDASTAKDATHKFGPYLKVSEIPINLLINDNSLKCDITTTDITVGTSDGTCPL